MTALLPLAASLWLACRSAPEEAVEPPHRLSPQDIATVQQGPISQGPRISGTLEPGTAAVVRAEVGGSVTMVAAEVGQLVSAGDVIARIEGEEAGAELAAARAALGSARRDVALAQRDVDRTEALVGIGALAERDLEVARITVTQAQSRVVEAQSRVTTARARTADLVVEAPIPGVVGARTVDLGDVVVAGADLFTVVDLSTLRLAAAVPADALRFVASGTRVTFEVQGLPGRTFVGRIEHVAPAVDPETRQLQVLATLPNPDGRLIAGLFADGRIAAALHEALLVPIESVTLEPTPRVMVVRDGRVEEALVDIGLIDEDRELVEITEGLALGEVVLIAPPDDIDPGDRVQLPPPAAPIEGT